MFTQNRVQAAPVRIARFHLEQSRGLVSAVLINAGNANCATRTGDRVALACCDAVAKQLRVPAEQVFPASTGVIGVELDAQPDRQRAAGSGRAVWRRTVSKMPRAPS